MSWNPLKLKYRRAQSGPYVFMNLVSYNNWVDTNEIPPDGLAYLHSPLGCPVFALHDTIEYIACACVHQDPPSEFLTRVRAKTQHLSLIAEMLFVLDEISDFEKMIAIYPEIAEHILEIGHRLARIRGRGDLPGPRAAAVGGALRPGRHRPPARRGRRGPRGRAGRRAADRRDREGPHPARTPRFQEGPGAPGARSSRRPRRGCQGVCALRWTSRWRIAGAPKAAASEGQLVQILVNLFTNAARAAPEGRKVHVQVLLGPGAPGTARIDVVDDGVGMAPEVLAHMFDPFFSTRGVGQGMGLGLAICHAIVTAHGGTISASSTQGQGTAMRVELPVA